MADDLFPPPTTADVSHDAKVAELEREITMRRRVYPRQVANLNMDQSVADRRILTMEAILADYLTGEKP